MSGSIAGAGCDDGAARNGTRWPVAQKAEKE